MTWTPHVTVATLVTKDDKFLIVEEWDDGQLVFNQPAGHLDPNESLIDAAQRETLEETGWDVEITGYMGVSLYTSPRNGVTYVRHVFCAEPLAQRENFCLDSDIKDTHWLSLTELEQRREQLRSPMVITTIEHFYKNPKLPLSAVY